MHCLGFGMWQEAQCAEVEWCSVHMNEHPAGRIRLLKRLAQGLKTCMGSPQLGIEAGLLFSVI